MKIKELLLIFLLTSGCISLWAQENKCLSDFEYVVDRIKNDYPGYSDKVNKENINELNKLEDDLRKKITQYPDSCYKYLNQYTDFYRDHHLRISYIRNPQKSVEKEPYDKKYAEFITDSLTKQTNTLEGIWVGFRGKFAIVKQDDIYKGIAIDLFGYDKNQLFFEAVENGENEYELTTYRNYLQFRPRKEKLSLLMNDMVIEIHDDTRFVRQTLDKKRDNALLNAFIPKYPNGLNTYPLAMYLSDSTFYLRISDFHSSTANDLVEKHWNEIMIRPNLIIDIRNNGGGQDNYYQKLAQLIYTNPYESKGVEWYATKGIIEDWEYAIENGLIKEGYVEESKALVEEMKKNIGGFVLDPSNDGGDLVERDTSYKHPKKVGIIINERNGSSAEQFLLAAKNSSKVILFGNKNTAGVLDYSNITPKELPSGTYKLWLPATRSRRLPENPIDNIGIAPDIYIPLESTFQLYDRLDNWVYFVKWYLECEE